MVCLCNCAETSRELLCRVEQRTGVTLIPELMQRVVCSRHSLSRREKQFLSLGSKCCGTVSCGNLKSRNFACPFLYPFCICVFSPPCPWLTSSYSTSLKHSAFTPIFPFPHPFRISIPFPRFSRVPVPSALFLRPTYSHSPSASIGAFPFLHHDKNWPLFMTSLIIACLYM